MKLFRLAALTCALLLASISALAQGTVTGALTGTVTSDGTPLPGVTVTVSSPNLQGTRMAVSDASGNYNFVGLPPGQYTARFDLEGLQSVNRTVQVTLSGTARADVDLKVSAVSEAITVTASAPAVIETTEVQANFQKKQVDDLPIARNPTAIANLAPGVTNNGPNNAMQISGAMAHDNLIMVDGATVQDNVRGTARPLFIEDAIQETTVISGAVSAEFGRFTGGVLNSVTKSGGNEFSGSFRDSLSNPRWTAQSAAEEELPESKVDNIYEMTLGGRIIRDRLWFFAAGRLLEQTAPARFPALVGTNQQIFGATTNNRYEGKLTGQVTSRHSLVATYLDTPVEGTNDVQIAAWELSAVDPTVENLENFRAVHYNGILTNNLVAELNWSKRDFDFHSLGGDDTDMYTGTPVRTFFGTASSENGISNSPWFCGSCDDESRDMKLMSGKLTYFLGTQNVGTHSIVGGVERFTELMVANNYQSASGLTVWIYDAHPVRQADGTVLFTWGFGDSVESFLVENPSLGSDLTTDSLYLNDKWDLNKNFSFNLGFRYDKTDAVDQAGNATADESSLSPRLGVTYDPSGSGRLRFGATYGKYVGRLAESAQGQGSNAGDPNWYGWYYLGDESFTGTAAEVVRHAVDWWLSNGGFNMTLNPPTDSNIGGVTTRLAGSLKAPDMNEWTVGAGFQYAQNGFVRADYINRDWSNFYAAITNSETGQVLQPSGLPADLTLVTNTDDLERSYRAIQVQANHRLFNRLNLGGSYTWSELRGNVEGENVGSGPITTGGWIFQYPEYQGFEQNSPVGYLDGDQTHKLRAWAAYDVSLARLGTLNFSVLQRYDSGRPYSALGVLARPTPTAEIDYVSPPQTVQYYFGERGAFRWDNISRTDLAVNYRLPIAGLEIFAEGEVFNAFNQQAQINGATTVVTPRNTTRACGTAGARVRCAAFNPFTDRPVEGVNYARLTPELIEALAAEGVANLSPTLGFGKANSVTDYQLARTYQFSLGVRF
jgi:outer membrane receptor protein involved in Fe transport